MPATTYDFLESLQDPTPDELASVPVPDDFDLWGLFYNDDLIDE